MHNPWCISFDRRCRAGGPGCCHRCPFRDDRTPEEKRDSLVASWLHHVKYRMGAKVEDVPIEVLGLPLRAEVARRDAETVLVKGDFGRGQRSKIMELVVKGGGQPNANVLTDEMVERAAEAIADEFGYALDSERHEEMYDAAYWKRIARRALEAALEEPS